MLANNSNVILTKHLFETIIYEMLISKMSWMYQSKKKYFKLMFFS